MLRGYVSIARYVVNYLYCECAQPKHLLSECIMSPQAGNNDRWKGIITYFQLFSYADLDVLFLLSVLLALSFGC